MGRIALALHMSPGKHGRVHKEKYHQQGKPFPVAVSFGHHPINFVVASTDVPNRVNEYDYAGGILGRPLQVVKGPLTGLPLPADAEIAIEGEVGVGRRAARRAFWRVDGLLCQQSTGSAGDSNQGSLFPQRSDFVRLPAAQAVERRQSPFLAHAVGIDLECIG